MAKKKEAIDRTDRAQVRYATATAIFFLLGFYTILLKEKTTFITNHLDILTSFSAWFITLTVGAMVPGLIYEHGKGYSRFFKTKRTDAKEKSFVFFLIDLIFGFFTVLIFGLFLNWLFPIVKIYLILIFTEWILLVYIWFCRFRGYRFPYFYLITINLILVFWLFIIYSLNVGGA